MHRRRYLAALAGAVGTGGCLRMGRSATTTASTTGPPRSTPADTPTATQTPTGTPPPPDTVAPLPGSIQGRFSQYAYDRGNTGSIPWPVGPTEEPERDWVGPNAGPAAPVVDAPTVYAARYGTLYALREGVIQWQVQTGPSENHSWSSPLLVDDLVVVGGTDGRVHAYTRDGGRRWQSAQYVDGPIKGSPTVASGLVLTIGGPELRALDLGDGTESWSYRTRYGSFTPAVAGGRVFVARKRVDTNRSDLLALRLTSGTLLWEAPLGDDLRANPPAVSSGRVYVASQSGTVYARDAATGDAVWSRSFDASFRNASPTIHDGTVYVGDTAGRLHALDAAAGSLQWSAAVGEEMRGPSVATEAGLFVVANEGTVAALDKSSGETRWTHSVGPQVKKGLAVLADAVVVATAGNGLHVLRAP